MKILIVGLGIQGKKRRKLIKKNFFFASVDIKNKKADFNNIEDVPLNKYDTVFICTPDNVKLKIIPSKPNTGITFIRTDIKSDNIIKPSVFNVSDASYCTTLSNDQGIKISTVEHLMAALFAKGIDNVVIEVDGPEIPILDGSSKDFLKLINDADVETSNQPIKLIKIEN